MKIKRTAAGLAIAALVAVGALGMALPANADDAPPPAPTATEEVAASPDTQAPAPTPTEPTVSTTEPSSPPTTTNPTPATPPAAPAADPAPATVPATPSAKPSVTSPLPSGSSARTLNVSSVHTPIAPTTYVTVAWLMPSWSDATTPSWPQSFAFSSATVIPDLTALDSQLTTCGTSYQVDVYKAGETTNALIAGGHLTAPGNPAEDLVQGGWGTAYKLVHNLDCVPTIAAAVTGVAVCNVDTYDITWTGTVTTEHAGSYIAERVKYTGSPVATIEDGVTPGTGFSYVTHVPGSSTSASASFHAHVTQAQAGVNPLDADVNGTVELKGDCAPPPVTCAPTGIWYSEDAAPEQTDQGYLFTGQSSAVDYYHQVTGNLQGLGTQSLTFADVHGYQPSFTIVLNRTGSTGYANLVAEWYQNGGSPDTAGTFTIDSTTKFWTNKIANPAPGSQSDPQPLAFFSALYPTNTLISVGAHLGSGSTADTHSVVTAIGGCIGENFTPQKPEPIVTVTHHSTTDCEATTDTTYTDTTTTEYVWDGDSRSYILGTPVTVETSVSQQATTEECPVTTPTPTPTPTETPSPTPTPVVPAANPPQSDSGLPAQLGKTGSNIDMGLELAIGFGLIVVAGLIGAAIIATRKRREN